MSKSKTLQKERTEPDRDDETYRDEIDVHDLPHQNMHLEVEVLQMYETQLQMHMQADRLLQRIDTLESRYRQATMKAAGHDF